MLVYSCIAREESSSPLRMDSAQNPSHESNRGNEEECTSQGEKAGTPKVQVSSASTSISKGYSSGG